MFTLSASLIKQGEWNFFPVRMNYKFKSINLVIIVATIKSITIIVQYSSDYTEWTILLFDAQTTTNRRGVARISGKGEGGGGYIILSHAQLNKIRLTVSLFFHNHR